MSESFNRDVISHLLGTQPRTVDPVAGREAEPETYPMQRSPALWTQCFSNIFLFFFFKISRSHTFKTNKTELFCFLDEGEVSAVSSLAKGTLEGPRNSINTQESSPEIINFLRSKPLLRRKPILQPNYVQTRKEMRTRGKEISILAVMIILTRI